MLGLLEMGISQEHENFLNIVILILETDRQTKTLPQQDCSFPDFTQKCMNYINLKIVTKQRDLSAITMFTIFTSLHWCLVEVTLPRLGKLTQAAQFYPDWVTILRLGNHIQAG